MNYRGYVKKWADTDLVNGFYRYPLDMSKVDDAKKEAVLRNCNFGVNDDVISAHEYEITDYEIEDAADFSNSWFDADLCGKVLERLIKTANHYLIFADGCRWNGASGYGFVDNRMKILNRDYDVTIYPVDVSKGGKILKLRESSHDVPMGSTTYAVALTDKEYHKLMYMPYHGVRRFVEDLAGKAKFE